MSLNITTYRTEVRAHLENIDSTDLTNVEVDLLLNRSYWQVSANFPFRAQEVTATLNTVDGTRRYAVPTPFEHLKGIAIEDPDTLQHDVIDRMTRDYYEQEYNSNTSLEGKPKRYFREDDDIVLYPTPDQIYQLIVSYMSVFSDLSDSNVTPEIPREWHEILLYGAVWRGFTRLGEDAKSRELRALQQDLITNITTQSAKETFDSHRAGISLPEELTEI